MVSYKRKDQTARNVLYGGHPPSCTCAVCAKRRLRRLHGYPKWFWLIAILLPPVGSMVVGFIAGLRYHRWIAGTFMVITGIAIAWFVYIAYQGGNVWELLKS